MCRFVIVLLEMAGSRGGGGESLRCQNVVTCTKNYEII